MKTKDLIDRLKTLQVEDEEGNQTITLEGIQERGIPANMQPFLFAVAGAEGFTR